MIVEQQQGAMIIGAARNARFIGGITLYIANVILVLPATSGSTGND
jgi:hypothetical protein